MFIDSIFGWASMILTITALTDPKRVPNAKIRIQMQAAKNNIEGSPSDDGGQIPQITLGGTGGEYLGKYWASERGKLKANQYWNYDIDTVEPVELKTLNLRMEYYGAGNKYRSLNDGLCLARMSWTPNDAMPNYDSRAGAITGDLFYFCGYSWYNSGQYDPKGKTQLRCGWLDGDNSNGGSVSSLFINTDVMGQGFLEDYAKNKDLCYWGVSFGGGSISLSKREDPASVFGNRAYVTSSDGAIALCDSATSWGPSMLSLEEGIFCDMFTKTKIPLCTDDIQKGCVKYNRQGGRSNRGGALRAAPTTATRTLQAVNVSRDDISFLNYNLEYFQLTDLNGTVIDD
ncbi:hypothetical protein BGZ47_003958, partial [Haplosporangium gracile]